MPIRVRQGTEWVNTTFNVRTGGNWVSRPAYVRHNNSWVLSTVAGVTFGNAPTPTRSDATHDYWVFLGGFTSLTVSDGGMFEAVLIGGGGTGGFGPGDGGGGGGEVLGIMEFLADTGDTVELDVAPTSNNSTNRPDITNGEGFNTTLTVRRAGSSVQFASAAGGGEGGNFYTRPSSLGGGTGVFEPTDGGGVPPNGAGGGGGHGNRASISVGSHPGAGNGGPGGINPGGTGGGGGGGSTAGDGVNAIGAMGGAGGPPTMIWGYMVGAGGGGSGGDGGGSRYNFTARGTAGTGSPYATSSYFGPLSTSEPGFSRTGQHGAVLLRNRRPT